MGRSPQARLQNFGPDTLRDRLVFDMHGLELGTALMQPFFFRLPCWSFSLPPSAHPCLAIKTGAAESEVVPYEVSLLGLPTTYYRYSLVRLLARVSTPALWQLHIILASIPARMSPSLRSLFPFPSTILSPSVTSAKHGNP